MSSGLDVSAEVAAAVGDRTGVWQFIRDFAGLWHSPLADHDGYSEADMNAAEERLGVRLPAAVREAYGLFGRRRDLTCNQDDLFSPMKLDVAAGGQVLVFRQEAEGCAHWGVPLHLSGNVDPPVVVGGLVAGPGPGWAPYLDRFSLACLEMVLSESLFTGRELDDSRQLDDASARSLEQNFTRLALPAYPLWRGPPIVRWFAGPDVILRADGDTWVWVRTRTVSALNWVREVMPGGWVSGA